MKLTELEIENIKSKLHIENKSSAYIKDHVNKNLSCQVYKTGIANFRYKHGSEGSKNIGRYPKMTIEKAREYCLKFENNEEGIIEKNNYFAAVDEDKIKKLIPLFKNNFGWGSCLYFIANTGIALDKALNLQWNDINFQENYATFVDINKSKVKLFLNKHLMANFKKDYKQLKDIMGSDSTSYVFSTKNACLSESDINKYLNEYDITINEIRSAIIDVAINKLHLDKIKVLEIMSLADNISNDDIGREYILEKISEYINNNEVISDIAEINITNTLPSTSPIAVQLSLPLVQEKTNESDILNDAKIKKLVLFLNEHMTGRRYGWFIKFSLYTGISYSSLRKLRWKDIIFDSKIISINNKRVSLREVPELIDVLRRHKNAQKDSLEKGLGRNVIQNMHVFSVKTLNYFEKKCFDETGITMNEEILRQYTRLVLEKAGKPRKHLDAFFEIGNGSYDKQDGHNAARSALIRDLYNHFSQFE